MGSTTFNFPEQQNDPVEGEATTAGPAQYPDSRLTGGSCLPRESPSQPSLILNLLTFSTSSQSFKG